MKKKILFGIIALFVISGIIFVVSNYSHEEIYTYEWVEVKDSSIGQYRLFINDSNGNHIDGVARIVYINGKSQRVNIDKEGILYVKSVVASVRNPNKR